MQLLFTRHTGFLSFVIRALTISQWDHVDLVWGAQLIGAVNSHAASTNAAGGVQNTTVAHRLGQSGVTAYCLCEIDLPDEHAAFMFARDQIGKPYDWSGVYALCLRQNSWEDPARWFCSELAAATAKAGGYNLADRLIDASRVTPGRIFKNPDLKTLQTYKAT